MTTLNRRNFLAGVAMLPLAGVSLVSTKQPCLHYPSEFVVHKKPRPSLPCKGMHAPHGSRKTKWLTNQIVFLAIHVSKPSKIAVIGGEHNPDWIGGPDRVWVLLLEKFQATGKLDYTVTYSEHSINCDFNGHQIVYFESIKEFARVPGWSPDFYFVDDAHLSMGIRDLFPYHRAPKAIYYTWKSDGKMFMKCRNASDIKPSFGSKLPTSVFPRLTGFARL